jgi:8-oxo-dGTP pyrophosphatase MutT (NUDIX family)
MKLAAGVIVTSPFDPNLILSFRRSKGNKERGASLPCGKAEIGETPLQAAVRECREETGWTVSVDDKLPFIAEEKKDGFKVYIFSASINQSIEREIFNGEEGEPVWATPEDLMNGPFGEFNRDALQHFGFIKS